MAASDRAFRQSFRIFTTYEFVTVLAVPVAAKLVHRFVGVAARHAMEGRWVLLEDALTIGLIWTAILLFLCRTVTRVEVHPAGEVVFRSLLGRREAHVGDLVSIEAERTGFGNQRVLIGFRNARVPVRWRRDAGGLVQALCSHRPDLAHPLEWPAPTVPALSHRERLFLGVIGAGALFLAMPVLSAGERYPCLGARSGLWTATVEATARTLALLAGAACGALGVVGSSRRSFPGATGSVSAGWRSGTP